MEKDLNKKAEFILGGEVLLPKNYRPPFRLSRSTAGPGAGGSSMVFAFNGMRVKKTVSYDNGEFELLVKDTQLDIFKNGKMFLENVEIQPVIFHSPCHAFFNLDQNCMFRCIYCASPLLGKDITKNLTDEKIIEMIRSVDSETNEIALTSGVVGSVQETVERMASCVKALRKAFPNKTIGVEPYVDTKEQIDLLKVSGADEIKLNRECARQDIFDIACPDLDYGGTLKMLRYAVSVFGKGHVASNIIYGLGENDSDVIEEMERLASIGVIPGLRALKISSRNKEKLTQFLGDLTPVSEDRMISLAESQKQVLLKYGLTTETFKTMCFECQCCDIVPFKDL
jgi:Lipoate synthase